MQPTGRGVREQHGLATTCDLLLELDVNEKKNKRRNAPLEVSIST